MSLRFPGPLRLSALSAVLLCLNACTEAQINPAEEPASTKVKIPALLAPEASANEEETSTTEPAGKPEAGEIVLWQKSTDFIQGNRRCASDTDPSAHVVRAAADCSMNNTTIKPEYNPASGSTLEVQVVFHIVQRTNGQGAISDALVQSQIDVLNEDYQALAGTPGAGGNNVKLRFKLATKDPSGNATSGITRSTNNTWFKDPGPGAANAMKQALNWDPTRYLNIYTNDANGALGYATFPAEDAGTYQDGVVLLWSSVGRDAPEGGIYDQGRTATHEVGHYFGLLHTFQSGCGSTTNPYKTGDRIKDTPPQSDAQFDCPTSGSDPVCNSTADTHNYMNYTQDTCMFRFTAEQANRIRCSISSYRQTLVQTTTTPQPGQNAAPIANFTASVTGLKVLFTDTSSDSDGTVNAWAWNFGDQGTATTRNPQHTYAAAGNYTVTLTATDNAGAKSVKTATVTVASDATVLIKSGIAVANLGAAAGNELDFAIDVPAGKTKLTVTINGGVGDADLYVRRAAPPTTSTFDLRPYKWGNNETGSLTVAAAGRYFITLRAYADFSGVTLTATAQ
jgi:PKD repeat protein